MMHGLAKGGLFLCAGIVEQNTQTKDITKLGGLIKTMPVTAIAFLFCSFSVMGIPPFGGFFSKYMVMTSTIKAGDYVDYADFPDWRGYDHYLPVAGIQYGLFR